jgi:uncharacterized protein
MYKHRLLEKTLTEYLNTFKAVALIGPKFCGKTTLSERFSKSSIYLNPLNKNDYMTMLQLSKSEFLSSPYPKLIDEWQLIPEIWDVIRHEVDHKEGRGFFILTGSSAANLDETAHSGAGRISRLTLRPMSLYESSVSTGEVSLNDLFLNSTVQYKKSSVKVEDYAKWIIKGGWPESIDDTEEQSIRRMQSYVDALVKEDINKVSSKKYNENRTRKILESLARYTASETTNQNIIKDLSSFDSSTSENTLVDYLDVLNKLYIIEDLQAWNPNLRSKTVIRSTPARFFIDPSIGAIALKLTSSKLLKDFETFGLFFEALVIRDLRIYAEVLGGQVYRYKDKSGLEIDAIIQLNDGKWGAVQVKMGSHLFDDAADKLKKFAEKIDTKKMGDPSFLTIISATEYAYQRDDGVYVIPIGMLKD